MASRGPTGSSFDIADLISCEDPLSFLMRDLRSRIEYILRLASGDSLHQMEQAFFLLFKTAQRQVEEFYNDEVKTHSFMQFIHLFHGMVDTTQWTKLFYCMAIDTLSTLQYFSLTDMIKIKLWTFSSVVVCEARVRDILSRSMTEEIFEWCSSLQPWGSDLGDFVSFIDSKRVVEESEGSDTEIQVPSE